MAGIAKMSTDSNMLSFLKIRGGVATPGFNPVIPAPSLPSLISTEPVELLILLPKEQVGFRKGCSTVDQVAKLTETIEDA